MTDQELFFAYGDSGLIVQVSDLREAGPERISAPGRLLASAKVSFEEAVLVARTASEAVHNAFRDSARVPDEIEVEFGIKFTATAGVIVSSGSAEASLKIKCAWKGRSTESTS